MTTHEAIEMACAVSQRAMPGLFINPDFVKRRFPNFAVKTNDAALDRALAAVHRANAEFFAMPCVGRA